MTIEKADDGAGLSGSGVERLVRPLYRGRDCACPTDSALHCAWLRYGDSGEDCRDEPTERCECRCHEQDDYDD